MGTVHAIIGILTLTLLLLTRFIYSWFKVVNCLQQLWQFVNIGARGMLLCILALKLTENNIVLVVQVNLWDISLAYIWSALVCSIACTSCLVRLSSLMESKLFASSATRGWKSNDLYKEVVTYDSDIGSSLRTTKKRRRSALSDWKVICAYGLTGWLDRPMWWQEHLECPD